MSQIIPDSEESIPMPEEALVDPLLDEEDLGWNEIITYPLIDKLCQALKLGVDPSTACHVNGLTKGGFDKWIKKGTDEIKRVDGLRNRGRSQAKVKKRLKIYVVLVLRVRKVLAECEMVGVMGIKRAASGMPAEFAKDRNGEIILDDRGKPIQLRQERAGNWFAWAWFLERRFPEHWSRTDIRDVDEESPTAPTIEQGADLDELRSADKELKELEAWERQQRKDAPEPIEAEYVIDEQK
jgi:hypothetical protein